MAWNISKTKRQALVKLQLRDKDGKFIEMGGGVKWYSSRLKKVVAGTVVGSKGENALVRLNKENPTHEPALVSVPAASIQAIDGKASLSPKGEPTADETPEFDAPEAVADVEADPNAEADSDHESQLKGPQHLAANYGITETSDGNTYITRKDGESIYSPARALKVGDELISPAGADPTKPFSIGRGWATKGTERLNKEGEGPVIGKVIAISENRYAVVQMAGGHTIADRRNPEEQTDTVTVGLSNQVILATMGLKDALGDRVSSQTYAERPSDEEKEVAPDAPEAQSDHEGREVPEDQLEAEGQAAPVDRAQVLKDMPVGGRIMTESGSQVFEKRSTNQWAFVSGNGDLITDDDVLGMVARGESNGDRFVAYEPEDSVAAEPSPEGSETNEAPETQPAPESPAEEAPEAVEEAPEAPEEAPEPAPVAEEAPQAKTTPVNDIVEGLAELEQAAEDVEGSGLDDEESEEVLNGASFGVVGTDGTNYNVTAEKDENGDWNFVVADENGAEVASHVIGSEENRVLAEKIANPTAKKTSGEAPAAEATPESAPEATPEAPEAESYNENGLTEQEQRELTSYTRLASRSYEQFKDSEGDRYKALADELLARGEERKASAPAQTEEAAPESAPITGPTDAEKIANAEKMYGTGSPQHLEAQRRFGAPEAEAPAPAEKEEKAPESAPEPEKAPEVTPEEAKPVEDAPAPSLVEPDAAPEEAEKPLLNGEEGYVPIDGRGLKAEDAPAKPEPFGISFERRPDGLDHAVAARPEVMTPEEAEEFRRLDIDLTWAQHENRSGREAIARGKLADLGRRVQSRIDSESFSRESGDDGSAEDTSPAQTTEEDHPTPLPDEQIGEIRERLNAPAAEPEAPSEPVVDPNANEDGLLPDEASRLTDLENRQAAAFRGESDEDPASFDQEISELIRHGRLRGRGREVGPFRASNPVPDRVSEQDSSAEPEATPETPEAPAAEAPAAPAARRTRNSEPVPVADADGNMITRGDKIGHPTLGPVEITNTIPGTGRIEFIDPTTGRKKSVKAARVRKIDPNAAEASPEDQPTTAAPGERFVDAATGKQGFGDKAGNRVLVGDRVRDANGNTGTVKSVYTAASGGAWIPVQWDSDGKVRRAMGNVLEKDDSTAPEASPEATPEPIEVVRPSATPAPAPERVEPAEEPFEPVLPSATPAPAPQAAPAEETHETGTARRQALVEATPVNGKISSGSQNFYKISETQWQFNEGSLLTPTAVVNMMALGERRGEVYEIGEGRPAEVNDTPVVDFPTPATPESALPEDPNANTPGRRAQLVNRLRSMPVGTKLESRGGEQVFTKEGDDNWSSNVDPGSVLDSDDIGGLLLSGRARGLRYDSTLPDSLTPVEPEIALEADSLVPPTVASRQEAFSRAPIGTTVTSPSGAATWTKQADDEWVSDSIPGAVVGASTLALATDSDNGYWVFNKTGPAEPEGTNITAMSSMDKARAFRMAPIGAQLVSTGGKVITKTADRLWTSDNGTEYDPSDLITVTDARNVDVSGPFGLVLPEVTTPANTLPEDRIERSKAIAALPLGTVITIGEFTFTKTAENNWEPTGYTEPHNDMDVAYAGSRSVPGTFVLPAPKPIPQDLESRVRVSEEAPIGTVVTSSMGESYTKISNTHWADTATLSNFKYALGEFATKLKNNVYTGDYFVQGFHVPDIEPDINADGSTTQPIPADEAAREALIESLPVGATVQHEAGRSFRRVGPNRWLDEATQYDEADFYVSSLIGRRGSDGAQGWTATTPAPEPEAPAAPPAEIINSDLPVGTLLPSVEGSTSGLKRVGPDKWEMVKDGQPTGRFVTDDTVKMFQELQGTTPTLPVDNRMGTPLGFSPEELNLPGGKSLGAFLQGGGSLENLSTAQTQAIQRGYDNFIENLNTLMPEGYTAQLDKPIAFTRNGGMSTSVAFYYNGRKLTSQSYSTGSVGSNASRHFRTSTDSRTGKRVSSVEHALFELPKTHQGSGVSSAFLRASKQMYRQMGLDRITIHADISVGGYAWARGGFDFRSSDYMDEALSDWEMRSQWNIPVGREAEWAEGLRQFNALKAQATALAFKNKTHPAPIAFANIGRPEGNPSSDDTWFGKHMMLNSDWYGDFPLNPLG